MIVNYRLLEFERPSTKKLNSLCNARNFLPLDTGRSSLWRKSVCRQFSQRSLCVKFTQYPQKPCTYGLVFKGLHFYTPCSDGYAYGIACYGIVIQFVRLDLKTELLEWIQHNIATACVNNPELRS